CAVLQVLDGRCLRREELVEAAASHVSAAARDRLLSGFAFFGGADICQGPPQGSRITLARADQWVRRWKEADPRKALREVCRRFIATYGPVTPSDFGEWIGSRILRADAWRE